MRRSRRRRQHRQDARQLIAKRWKRSQGLRITVESRIAERLTCVDGMQFDPAPVAYFFTMPTMESVSGRDHLIYEKKLSA